MTPGSRAFFESFTIPGLRVKSVHPSPGYVHIVLLADIGADVELLRNQYLTAYEPVRPLGQAISVSIETPRLDG